jgi:hypothetical protein
MGIEKQSRRMSLVEAITNVVVGFGVALLTQIIVFPLFDLAVSLGGHRRVVHHRLHRTFVCASKGFRNDPGTADEDGSRHATIPGPPLVLNSWLCYL